MGKASKPKKKAKDTYRHGHLKNALMEAALSTIRKTGEVEFSLRELADKVGVSHAAAYRHFSSKKEIFFEIALDGFSRLNKAFEAILEKEASDIVSLGVAYVTFAVENPTYFKIMFHPDLKIDNTHPEVMSVGAKTFIFLNECVSKNKGDGVFSNNSVQDLSVAAWSLVHGLAVLAVNGNLEPLTNGAAFPMADLAKRVATILVNGLKKR